MHNTYVCSTLLSLRTKGSLSFSFYDYSNLLNERFDKTPLVSRCCSGCCCCHSSSCCGSFATHRVPINPRYLYGLRQSTLIQWTPFRRFVLGSKDWCFYRFPVYDVDHDSCEVYSSTRERSGNGSIGRRRKGASRCMVKEEKSERYPLGDVEVEALISLLSEQVGGECFDGRERNGSSWTKVKVERRNFGSEFYGEKKKRVEVEKRGNNGGECYGEKKKRVDIEKRGDYGCECCRGKKKSGVPNLMGSDSNDDFKSVTIESREEEYRRKVDRDEMKTKEQRDEREAFSRGEDHRGRRKSSSCSSYYSFSSSRDFENYSEGHDEEQNLKELSGGYKKESSGNEEGEIVRQMADDKTHRVDIKHSGEVSEQRHTTVGIGVGWDCRKTSEKKLTEASHSREESSRMHTGDVSTHGNAFGLASTAGKTFSDEEEKLSVAVNFDKGSRKECSQMGDEGSLSESRRKFHAAGLSEIASSDDTGRDSQSKKQVSVRDQSSAVTADLVWERRDDRQTVRRIADKDELRGSSQQFTEESEIPDVDTERVSNSCGQYESRMKIREEDTTSVLTSAEQTKEQHHQTGEKMIKNIDLRRKSQQFSELSEIRGSMSKMTSNLQSETRMKNQTENSSRVTGSYAEVEEQCSETFQKPLQKIQSTQGSQDPANLSLVRAGDIEILNESQIASKTRLINQEVFLSSNAKLTRETDNQTDERVMQISSRKEEQKPIRLSSSRRNALEEAEGQQIDEQDRERRSSNIILMSSSSQSVAGGSQHVVPTSGITIGEVSSETLESGFTALYTHSGDITSDLYTYSGERTPSLHKELYGRGQGETPEEPLDIIAQEDVLGSAHRSAESSTQFVGEFVEKAKNEVSTSEVQKNTEVSVTKVVYVGEKHRHKSSDQYGSSDVRLKEHDSRRSSRSSGAKGPSDEMWDVIDPSIRKTPEVEAPEDPTEMGNTIVKRTGRSLWSIISNVFRMQWGSHGETRNSAARSGGKSSSNESASSEAWFSGREQEEKSEKNVVKDRSSTPQESTSSHELQIGKTFSQSQGEASDTVISKDQIQHLEPEMHSLSSKVESGFASTGVPSTSAEENLGQDEEGKRIQGYSSGMEVVGFSAPLRVRSLRRSPAVEENFDTGKIDASGSGSLQQMEQPVGARLTEVTGPQGKDGELKLRKLQRNKQVLRDRFDEWEDAYKLESEQRKTDEMFMREALLEAKKAADTWEVPVGAVLVQNGKIIARGCNLVEELRDSTAHAEMICIREASNVLRTWRLADTTLYVTLEPCPMCAGAILQARISSLVWGAPNKLLGADGSWIRLFPSGGQGSEQADKPAAPVHPFHPKMTIRRGVLASECADRMTDFFQLRRKKEKNEDPLPPPSRFHITNHPSKILTKMHDIFHIMFCL
ncbi:dCMP_cyt_deam_1 domain-containing protein [Cephalotus follicularis]|uniref:tRNA(adenine(34)) deaminase n=1 Tax=Cephalotus follicularis TaxID=3775 RepID=A0A1Q3BZM0_CEPFO|nr:dCMP_cyt_deam_1 domain-containing protein [Cephalotus follicularis]